MAFDEKLAARVRSALKGRRDVVEKQMFGGVAFMVRGHMSCGVVGSSLMVRVDVEQEENYLKEPAVRRMDFTGRPMRGFLFVDPAGITTMTSLAKWVDRSVTYAETKPKKLKAKSAAPQRRGKR
jgi:TfoX/Sxy family transcriptional regulator of competence genes